jgi:hypothetical protein
MIEISKVERPFLLKFARDNGYKGTMEQLTKNPILIEDFKSNFQLGGVVGIDDLLQKAKTYVNPKNWGVTDYTDKFPDKDKAFAAARKAGEKEYLYKGVRYTTNYKGTPQQQLKETGITDDRLGVKNSRSDKAYNSVKPSVYLSKEDVNQQLINYFNSKNRFDNTEINKLRKQYTEEGSKENYDIKKIKEIEKKMFSYEPAFHGEDDVYSEDAWKIYLGKPQTKNTFSISNYKPSLSKENNINYYSLPNDFKQELFDLYNNGQIKKGINNEFSFSNIFDEVSSRARVLGNFTVDEGKDEKGSYISYYDKYDLNPNLPVIGNVLGLENFVGKPFEIYDRIYYNDYGDGQKKRMYYSDKELSELDLNKKNFDTLALQRELANRGYNLPKSTKADGTFDGILGDETIKALEKYKQQKGFQFGGVVASNNSQVVGVEKMQVGGDVKPTIYVDPNDPKGRERYQAYNDSLDLYNLYKYQESITGNTGKSADFNAKTLNSSDIHKDAREALGFNFWGGAPVSHKQVTDYERQTGKSGYLNTDTEEYKKLNNFNRNNNITIIKRSSPEFYHKSIEPTSNYKSQKGAANFIYKKPTQPVKYKPNPEGTEKSDKNNSNFTSTPTPYGNRLLEIPKGEKESDYEIKTYYNSISGNNDWTYVKKKLPNPEIVAKQQQLIDAGFNIGEADGVWGKKSKEAWEQYQQTLNQKIEQPKNFVEKPQPLPQTPKLKEGERTAPAPNLPNIDVIYVNNKPTFYQNKEGKRIPYGTRPNAQGILSFQVGGRVSLSSIFDNGGEVKNTEKNIYGRDEYVKDLKTNYTDFLKQADYKIPYFTGQGASTQGGYNCINGVCTLIQNTTKKQFSSPTKTYTGNATFLDNINKEGFYKVDNIQESGIDIGDVLQYARYKGDMFSRFDGKVTPKNKKELYPNHAVLVVDKYDKDGEIFYKIANNKGGEYFIDKDNKKGLEDITQKELYERAIKGYKDYRGIIVNRYDPEKAREIEDNRLKRLGVLKGENTYAKEYQDADFDYDLYKRKSDLQGNIKQEKDTSFEYLKPVMQKAYSTIGKGSDIPKQTFDELLRLQIGIMGQETNYGKDLVVKDLIPDKSVPKVRKGVDNIKDTFGLNTEDNWKKDYWLKNADNVKAEFNTYEDFLKSFEKEGVDKRTQEWLYYNSPKSKGSFQQKELSPRGVFYGLDLESVENQFLASTSLAVDNYHVLKNKYPNLTEKELVKLTVLMHNAPSKALNERFVNYYLKNDDIDYVKKVESKSPLFIKKGDKQEVRKVEVTKDKADELRKYLSQFQKGGRVSLSSIFDNGGEVKRGTKEYKEAYEKGQVVRQTEDGTLIAPQLREVVIEDTDDRVKNAVRGATGDFAKDYIAPTAKMAASIANPVMGVGISAIDIANALYEGQYGTALLGAGAEALPYGVGKASKYVGKPLLEMIRKGSNNVDDVSKKFKINNENFYRSIDLDDAVNSGVIRSKQSGEYAKSNPYFVEGKDFDKLSSTGSGASGSKPKYIFETSMVDETGTSLKAYPTNATAEYSPYIANKSSIPISEGKIYKLNDKGEYELFNPVSSVDDVAKGFKSEIDWGKWNKEIPKPTSSIDDVEKMGFDGNFITRPLTPFTKNELTKGKQLYRKIGGKKGLEDLISKKGSQAPSPMKMKSGVTIDTPFFGIGSKPNENYSGIFAIEHPLPSKSKYDWTSRAGGVENWGSSPIDPQTGGYVKNIPLEDLEVYRKKWFSNNYKKLDKNNLQKELKSANIQELSEKLYKWGIRGYLADQIINDGDLTGGNALKIIDNYLEDNNKISEEKPQFQKGGRVKLSSIFNEKVKLTL